MLLFCAMVFTAAQYSFKEGSFPFSSGLYRSCFGEKPPQNESHENSGDKVEDQHLSPDHESEGHANGHRCQSISQIAPHG